MMSEPVAALPRVSVPQLDIVSYIRNLLSDAVVHFLRSPYQLISLVLSSVKRNVIIVHLPELGKTEDSIASSLEAAGKLEFNIILMHQQNCLT
jgi:hypothetical protein